jgi:hypothetical protein
MQAADFGQIVHSSPGRVRLRLARPFRTPPAFKQVEDGLSALEGVQSLQSNHTSGSILVLYDPVALPPDRLLQLGRDFGLVPAASPALDAEAGEDWRSQIDTAKVGRSLVVLAAAVLGGVAAPAVGVSARVGSISAALVTAYLSRLAGQLRTAGDGHRPA